MGLLNDKDQKSGISFIESQIKNVRRNKADDAVMTYSNTDFVCYLRVCYSNIFDRNRNRRCCFEGLNTKLIPHS